ncbi:hypothetical protein H6F42_19975, partial [Pseudanabaena sp. FACHB-1998]|uniref:hypothetical protein n=1 Tax=Pseudanabaena sp. FACHB-1998 TaxID=2692858 RepID=UPI0016809B55
IHLAILCEYSSVFVLVIVWLDYLSAYIPDFTHFTLHSPMAIGLYHRPLSKLELLSLRGFHSLTI